MASSLNSEPSGATPLPRAIERQLRPYGVVRVEAHPQWPIAMQATETLRPLWGNMRDRGVVVWVDNCYEACYAYNPVRMRVPIMKEFFVASFILLRKGCQRHPRQ